MVVFTTLPDKKLSCRRETAPSFVSVNISLSHSSSVKIVPFKSLDTVSYSSSVATLPNMSNAVQGLSLGSGGSASLAQLLGIGYHLTCSAVQTDGFKKKLLKLFCFNLLLINFSLRTFFPF